MHNFKSLIEQQIYYHTHLKATHTYASPFWSWPLNLYPVWFYVQYQGKNMANIFASGNPLVFWFGSISIIITLFQFYKKHKFKLFIILIGFLSFLLPWATSPRIMFLYYFSPALPFLSIALAIQINRLLKSERFANFGYLTLILITLSFLLIYPFLVGIGIPKDYIELFFSFNLSKNPF